jgi:ABC-type multidrug transport system ATPase subunit
VSDAPLLTADSIGKRFGRRHVLTSASAWARPGRITALLGRNGAGKSTLLRVAAGWLTPDYGLVSFAGHRFVRPRLAELARLGMFYLPDRTLLCSFRTIGEHLAALRRAFEETAVEEATDVYRLGAFLDRKPRTLSGGERRRAEAALAWARRPTCLLADEPFRGLAPKDQELLAEGLRGMARRGTALVVTGHEAAALLDLADEVVWVTAGTTHVIGSPEDARANHQFMSEYLGRNGIGGAVAG